MTVAVPSRRQGAASPFPLTAAAAAALPAPDVLAVALHAADVGISVDSATDVAKDAADVLLLERTWTCWPTG